MVICVSLVEGYIIYYLPKHLESRILAFQTEGLFLAFDFAIFFKYLSFSHSNIKKVITVLTFFGPLTQLAHVRQTYSPLLSTFALFSFFTNYCKGVNIFECFATALKVRHVKTGMWIMYNQPQNDYTRYRCNLLKFVKPSVCIYILHIHILTQWYL